MSNKQKNENYWNQELLPKFINIFNEKKENLIHPDLINEYIEVEKQLNHSKDNFKKQFSNFKYCLSFICLFLSAILLFIPFYWSYNWNKSLKKLKKQHIKEIKTNEKNKLKIHEKIVYNLDLLNFYKSFESIMNYKHMGPINPSIIDRLNNFQFNPKKIKGIKSNSFLTSWGIFNNNKIVIHKSQQTLSKFLKQYHGSIDVVVNEKTNETVTISATYSHIAYSIEHYFKTYGYTQSCQNLEFYFDSLSSKNSSEKFNKKHAYSPLENPEFESKFNWKRNDEIQFRMFFTPLTQENYLKQINSSKVPPYLRWNKSLSYISSDYDEIAKFSWYSMFDEVVSLFLNDSKIDCKNFKRMLFSNFVENQKRIYKSLNFMYLISILESEDQKTIINEMIKDKRIDKNNLNLFFYSILNEFFDKEKIIEIDTDCYNEIQQIESIDDTLFRAKIKGTSFQIEKMIKNVPEMGPNGIVIVPVPYDNYIPFSNHIYLYSCFVKKELEYSNFKPYKQQTNIKDKQILELINEIEKNGTIVIKNNIIAILVRKNVDISDKVKNLILFINK